MVQAIWWLEILFEVTWSKDMTNIQLSRVFQLSVDPFKVSTCSCWFLPRLILETVTGRCRLNSNFKVWQAKTGRIKLVLTSGQLYHHQSASIIIMIIITIISIKIWSCSGLTSWGGIFSSSSARAPASHLNSTVIWPQQIMNGNVEHFRKCLYCILGHTEN